MNELTLPFIGTITIWPYVVGAILLLMAWDHIPTLIAWAIKGVFSLVSNTATAIVKPSPQVQAVKSGVGTSLQSLQALTVWAVNDATPEVLAKITALYGDLQKHVKDEGGK